jgi:hypothetical protein
MQKQLFDAGWEFSEAGMAAMLPGQWQPVTLPDASVSKPRSAQHQPVPAAACLERRGLTASLPSCGVEDHCLQLEFEGVYMGAEVKSTGMWPPCTRTGTPVSVISRPSWCTALK